MTFDIDKAVAIATPLVKLCEGKRLVAYRNKGDVWTIGYGHTNAVAPSIVKAGLTISEAQADALLASDLRRIAVWLARVVKVGITDNAAAALIDFAHNVGEEDLLHSTLLRKLNQGCRLCAAAQFARWTKGPPGTRAGLAMRRAREAALFLAPQKISG